MSDVFRNFLYESTCRKTHTQFLKDFLLFVLKILLFKKKNLIKYINFLSHIRRWRFQNCIKKKMKKKKIFNLKLEISLKTELEIDLKIEFKIDVTYAQMFS